MASRPDAGEVRKLLVAAFRARLEPLGWELLRTDDGFFGLAAFLYPLGEPWAATCEVSQASSHPDRVPVLVTSARVGVSYEPLRRLSPLLDLYDVSVLSEQVWPEKGSDLAGASTEPLEVKTGEDVDRVADRLTGLIVDRAASFGKEHADLDGLLAAVSDGAGTYADLAVGALQAAAGRSAEAQRSLAQLTDSEIRGVARKTRRAARQLNRWMDSGGDPSLIPAGTPSDRYSRQPSPSFAELRAQKPSRTAALSEVRDNARTETRERTRELLRAALARHGAREQSPLWIEYRLDHLWDSGEERVKHGVRTLARLGRGLIKAVSERELPDLGAPDWLEPPAHALYEIGPSSDWTAVRLDPDALPYIDRVYQATPQPFGFATLTAWIQPSTDGAGSGLLDVLLGQQRIAVLSERDAAAYQGVLSDAAARDEHPCLNAHLVHRNNEYLLEIARPSSATSVQNQPPS